LPTNLANSRLRTSFLKEVVIRCFQNFVAATDACIACILSKHGRTQNSRLAETHSRSPKLFALKRGSRCRMQRLSTQW